MHWPQIHTCNREQQHPCHQPEHTSTSGQAVRQLWAGEPQQAACSAVIPQLRSAGGAGSPSPDRAKAVPKNKAVETSDLVPHSYKEHFPCRNMLRTENRDGGGKVALYKDIVT